ncbi:serine/threonine-protein kinase [Amycolatopsis sp. NEAU-NG30]|uniref:non-specific serine/threonine protein kinase n=1 Tax=Amycolatopsis melonis TaxID=3156488 RepID=A0ABV0LAI2_9PSEU
MAFEDQLVNGRYRIAGEVGRGATSVVWRAVDERLDRIVAIKQLDSPWGPAHGADVCDPAIQEARLGSRIDHPYAIGVHDVFEESGSMYLVLEYLPSRSLTELLVAQGPLPPREVARLGRRIASALAAAHAKGVVHGDVSPNNVLVTGDGIAKITDFGYSRAVGDEPADRVVGVVGTPAYVAPEVAAGYAGGCPSDVFSLGATLYTALEGCPPFGASIRTTSILRRIVSGRLTPPHHEGPLADIILRMLDHDPAARPAMPEVVDLLRAVMTAPDRPVAAPPRRHRRVAAVAAASLVVAGSLVWAGTAGEPQTRGTAEVPPAVAVPAPLSSVTAAPPVVATSSRAVPVPKPMQEIRQAGCSARFDITNVWNDGAQVLVTVHNDRPTRLSGWVVSWKLPAENDIRQLWSGALSRQGPTVAVRDLGWNALLEPDASASFGFILDVPSGTPGRPQLTCRQT